VDIYCKINNNLVVYEKDTVRPYAMTGKKLSQTSKNI